MRKARDLIGKTIIQRDTGNTVAVVHDVIFDAEARNVAALLIHSGGWFKHGSVVPWSRVTTVGDVILVRGDRPAIVPADDPELVDQFKPSGRISGTPIVSDTGERLGAAGDLFIDESGAVVGIEVKQGFLTLADRKFLPADHVQAIGSDAVIADTFELPLLDEAGQEADEQPEDRNQPRDGTTAKSTTVQRRGKNSPQPSPE